MRESTTADRWAEISATPRHMRRAVAALVAVAGLCASGAFAQSGSEPAGEQPAGEELDLYELAQPLAEDGDSFPIGTITLRYGAEQAGLPELIDFESVEIELLQTSSGFVAPREGLPTVTLTIADINAMPTRQFYSSAVLQIAASLVEAFNERGIIGVFAQPDELYLRTGEDRRPAGDTNITMVVYTARVEEVRTIASGERVPDRDRVNSGTHQRVLSYSPIQPGGEEDADAVLRKDQLDRYVLWLNRHPGRRVDAAVAPGSQGGLAVLDYHIYESKPWSVYFQLSNTGTENTEEWRERFGLIHNQLTGRDDILTIDYITAGFDETNAIVASYETPLPGLDRVRVNLYGGYNEYVASDVGLAGEDFSGEGWHVGADLIFNVFQSRELFIDAIVGVKTEEISVKNDVVLIEGEEQIIYPSVGLQLERITETSQLTVDTRFEGGFGGDKDELERLGRVDPDDEWFVFHWDVRYSFFLEPLLDPQGWLDVNTPESSTLAHEVQLAFRGQNSLGNRLIPNGAGVVGGLYTVRGYDESVATGDSVYIFTGEYRFHVPRSFSVEPEPRQLFGSPFKFAPQQVYGRPDWDLVLKGFVDVGYAENSDALSFEDAETLVGAGIGAELQFRRNVTLRLDWGFALSEVGGGDIADSGDNRLHFVLTLLY